MPAVSAPDRKLVAARFSAASERYDEFAGHHRLIGAELLRRIEGLPAASILELGCGTGILSEGLSRLFPKAHKVFTDMAPGMVTVCRRRVPPSNLVRHTIWDFEETFQGSSRDLVVSSCALQWVMDPAVFVRRLADIVSPGGFTSHAIPVKGMLREIEYSFTGSGAGWNSLDYLCGARWDSLLSGAGFTIVDSCTKTFTLHYPSPSESLRAVTGIGASLAGHNGAAHVSTSDMRKALHLYRSMFEDASGMVPASYEIHFVTARRADH